MALMMNIIHSPRVVGALLAAPPLNGWTRPVLFQTCTRHILATPCHVSKPNKTSKAPSSSAGRDRSYSSNTSNSSSSSSTSGKQRQPPADQNRKSDRKSGQSSRNSSQQSSSSFSRATGSKTEAARGKQVPTSTDADRQQSRGAQSTQSIYSSRRPADNQAVKQEAPVSSPLPSHAPLLVVGAGAAGLTAAYFAAKQGAQVVVLERTREAGKKVLMSGGTRCNVLPLEADLPLDYFTSSSRSALRAVFSSWSLDECHAWLSRDVGLQMVLEEETRKWFPASNSGREVRDRLVAACQKLGVQFVYNASVEQITPPQQAPHHKQHHPQDANPPQTLDKQPQSPSFWRIGLASGQVVSAQRLIVSTGGYSFPAVGTDGTGLRLLKGLGHRLSDGGCYAALTPLKGPHPGGEQLAGLTLAGVRLSVLKGGSNKVLAAAQRGGLLFTHKGYSGPAVLDVSHWLVKELEQHKGADQQMQQQPHQQQAPRLVVDWTGEGLQVWQERFAGASGAATVNQLLRKHGIKERLANALAEEVGVTNKQISQLKKSEKEHLLRALTAWQLPIQGHEGYPKAEVTGGGVPLEQVDCKTMQSRELPGLYLCGEVLDVFGRIGGFNFWWAWLSGRLAGTAAGSAAAAATAGAAAVKRQRV